MCTLIDKNGFTLVELMMAVGFSVLLMAGVFGFYNVASKAYSSGITGQTLQDGATIILNKIIKGQAESGTIYRLESSNTFSIPVSNSSQLYFCQDNAVCGPADPTVRWYILDPTNTSLRYFHPTTNPLGYDTIYTAPPETTISLRFSPAQQVNPAPPPATIAIPNVIEIDVALKQNASPGNTNKQLATSGAASTFVLLRNHDD